MCLRWTFPLVHSLQPDSQTMQIHQKLFMMSAFVPTPPAYHDHVVAQFDATMPSGISLQGASHACLVQSYSCSEHSIWASARCDSCHVDIQQSNCTMQL